jgi:ribosomal protein L7/L12
MNDSTITAKFEKLKYRMTFATSKSQSERELCDIMWVKNILDVKAIRNDLTHKELFVANRMWRRYSKNPPVETDRAYMLECILSNRKIQAIKEYRKMYDCDLRKAKSSIEYEISKIRSHYSTQQLIQLLK